MKGIHSFSLDEEAMAIVERTPKYKRGIHKGKSVMVSDAIIKYGDDAPLSPSGLKHYQTIIAQLNERIMELEFQVSNLQSDPQVGGKTTRGGIFRHLYLRLRRKQEGR